MSETTEIKRSALIAAAKELNTLLDPDPKIKTVGVKTDELTKAIVVAASLLASGDALTTETHTVLCALEVELPEDLVVSADDATDEDADDAPEEKPEMEIKREDLVALIEEMNKVMDLDPAIEASEKSSIDGLKKLIHDNCYDKGECQVFDTDKFSPEAWETLTALGVRPVVTKKAKDKPAKAEKTEKPAKAGKTEKPAKAEKTKKEKAEKPAATKKGATDYTRSHALIDALKGAAGTREEIVDRADSLFVDSGGKTNQNVSNYMFGYVMPSLKILGIVRQTGKDFEWSGK